MKSRRLRILARVAALGALVAMSLMLSPVPAHACEGGGDFYDCKSYWLDALFYPCLADNCVGLPPGSGPGTYGECRRLCWEEYRSVSASDCSNCGI